MNPLDFVKYDYCGRIEIGRRIPATILNITSRASLAHARRLTSLPMSEMLRVVRNYCYFLNKIIHFLGKFYYLKAYVVTVIGVLVDEC